MAKNKLRRIIDRHLRETGSNGEAEEDDDETERQLALDAIAKIYLRWLHWWQVNTWIAGRLAKCTVFGAAVAPTIWAIWQLLKRFVGE